jgi:hypothetical protein
MMGQKQVVDVATMSDETQQRDEDEMVQAQKKFISHLGKISERIASDRKQYETDSRDPKIAGDDTKLQELLKRQKEKLTQHQRELASLLATNTRALHDTARSVANGHKLQADKHGKATQSYLYLHPSFHLFILQRNWIYLPMCGFLFMLSFLIVIFFHLAGLKSGSNVLKKSVRSNENEKPGKSMNYRLVSLRC